ncbi:hypothetical protein [Stackebrandtia nassauensis]|uniref:Uncharacterized protein n=1 Tax=Stackebrandtia nassauensis (strain DSM 44728 / CIP 108903 / NRRL B-16338 / NBRC 102104 / LLR-40K-21) TaxID=446470 RepID=D3Q402_STANL|nr:hypothetical protein [Stackebrandtia nassauensis]ADD45887.1 hypothetical protein Snas_6267 [Stackebrandtia nassauensis DSM 44728]
MTTTHKTTVEYDGTRRYPWLPTCTCGEQFWGYVAEHAAQAIVDEHVAETSGRPVGREAK